MKIYNNRKTLFYKLKKTCKHDWLDYTEHKFLDKLKSGDLPIKKFRKYLLQDYLFLQEFLKILSLSSYRSDNYTNMNRSIDFIISIKSEIKLHVKFCKKWNISINNLKSIKPLKQNKDYTDYVLAVGKKGSILDLFVCLAPCIIGYGEIGVRLSKLKNWKKSRYKDWIKMYASNEYQNVAKENIKYLDLLLREEKNKNFNKISKYFKKSTILEKNFWSMI